MARDDYHAADQLAPSPWLDACMGYCTSRLGQHDEAIGFYRDALRGGCDSPAVLNDLGHSLVRLRQFDAAAGYLQRAVERDDRLQAAHHNLALALYNRALEAGEPPPPEAWASAARAVEIGPESDGLCRDMAGLQVLAANGDPARRRSAVEYVRKAVGLGMDAKFFRSDPIFRELQSDPDFQKALAEPKTRHPSRPTTCWRPSQGPSFRPQQAASLLHRSTNDPIRKVDGVVFISVLHFSYSTWFTIPTLRVPGRMGPGRKIPKFSRNVRHFSSRIAIANCRPIFPS